MKKKVFLFCLGMILLTAFPAAAEVRKDVLAHALFVTVLQEPLALESRQAMDDLVMFSKKSGIKVLFVQVYRANQAWFPTKWADTAPYEKALKAAGEDPLAYLIKKAHVQKIEVHAWINLLSLSKNRKAPILERYGFSILTRNRDEKKVLKDYQIDNQYFLEPGDLRVRQELAMVLGDLLRAYPSLDGVQFDYIRYPDRHPAYGYTQDNIARFRKASGFTGEIDEKNEQWREWKRDRVTALLDFLTKRARVLHPGIQVSATGCMPYIRAYDEAFQDWALWINKGVVDFVTMMSYSPKTENYERWIEGARKKVDDFKKVYVGVGVYQMDGLSDVFSKEFAFCKQLPGRGCAFFHYGSFLGFRDLDGFMSAPVKAQPGK